MSVFFSVFFALFAWDIVRPCWAEIRCKRSNRRPSWRELKNLASANKSQIAGHDLACLSRICWATVMSAINPVSSVLTLAQRVCFLHAPRLQQGAS